MRLTVDWHQVACHQLACEYHHQVYDYYQSVINDQDGMGILQNKVYVPYRITLRV